MIRGTGKACERCSAASRRVFSDRAPAVHFCFTAAAATSSVSSVASCTSVAASAAARKARRWSCQVPVCSEASRHISHIGFVQWYIERGVTYYYYYDDYQYYYHYYYFYDGSNYYV